jgi:CubicO group peptidase (beta-lactamase class C family)
MIRHLRPLCLALLLLAPLLPALAQQTPEEREVVLRRMAALPLERGVEAVEAYQPAETVPGARRGVRPLPRVSPLRAGIAPAALAEAEALAEQQQSHALLVAIDGRLVLERYWNGFSRQSRFSTASMHKGVMALAMGAAAAEGRIGLADPVGRHIAEWRQDPRGAVTIAQLLEMASGLAFPPAPPGPPRPDHANLRLMFAPDIRKVALEVPQAAPPGTVFAYSNTDSQLAGEALAAALPHRYARFLSERIWKPIGAADAALFLDREGGSAHWFCCLQASAMDWLRVGELIRKRGQANGRQILPAPWIDGMTAPSALNPNFGRQIWRGSPHAPVRRYAATIALTIPAQDPFLAEDVVFLDGAGGQRVYAIPSARMVIVRIGRPALAWDDSALPNILLRGLAR